MADIFYTCSRQEAKSLGRLALWEESHQANIRCAHEIDSLIASHTKDGQLEPDCARAALDRWGFHRVQFVLSNTLRNARAQGFDPDSLKWARIPFVPPDKTNGEFKLKSDTALLAQFVRQAHTEFQKLGLFEARHCSAELDYEGKVLILRPAVLKEEYLSPRNQLWYCEGGFGCSPTSSGRAVYATCLGDGEKTRWDRADFVGVLDEKYLPDWAAEKLSALRGPAQEQTDGPGMEMEMPQFYVIDDLWRGELNITHFDNLRDAARAYTALTAANWKALGVRDGGDAVDLIRCVPTRPRDPDGEDVMVLEILEHPMWKSRTSLLVTAQDLAARFAVRYCLFQGCLLPIPTRDTLPKRLRDKHLWPSMLGKYETAIHWISVAGAGKLSLAEFKRRYRMESGVFSFPLVPSLSVHGQNARGFYCPLQVTPWEFHLLVRRSREQLDQNTN